MRIGACLFVLILVACDREPSFDERYADMANNIQGQASEMDSQLDNRAGSASDRDSSNDLAR